MDSIDAFMTSVKVLYDKSILTRRLKSLATHLLSPLKPTPIIQSNNHVWAVKNSMLMAQQLMLVATAYGLSTGPMEGFDERRVSYALDIPMQRYTIPLIINIGYSIDSAVNEDADKGYDVIDSSTQKIRFAVEDICYLNRYGVKLK